MNYELCSAVSLYISLYLSLYIYIYILLWGSHIYIYIYMLAHTDGGNTALLADITHTACMQCVIAHKLDIWFRV
jgi:hypothetical protein